MILRFLTYLFAVATVTFIACSDPPSAGPGPEAPATTLDPATDQQAARQLIQHVFDSIWSGTDTQYVRRYHTEDFVILEHGEVWTNDTIRNYQVRKAARQQPDAPVRKNSFDFFRTEQNGDEIWMAYHNYGHFLRGQDTVRALRWLESAVAVRTDEGWKLRMMHSTRVGR